MLEMMYSTQVLTEEMKGKARYWLVGDGEETIGYFSLEGESPQKLKLSKLYLKAERQGQGIGQRILEFIREYARDHSFKKIVLNVNKNNSKAIRAYSRSGFVTAASVQNDIGQGFVMDDYIMEYVLPD